MSAQTIAPGTRFEALEVTGPPSFRQVGKHRKAYYPVRCHQCGTDATAEEYGLRKGRTRECKHCGLKRRKTAHTAVMASAFLREGRR